MSENQDKNTFELELDEAHAGTQSDDWEAIQFFNELRVVSLKGLEPDDRTCSICMQPYDDPKEGSTMHVTVLLPWSHIFGKERLAKWTTPFGMWGK